MATARGLGGRRRTRCTRGFTYLGVLIVIAIIGIASTATLQVGALLERRAAEEELLEIGAEFRRALISYANGTPLGRPRSPATLNDLLKDPRYPGIRRHLRRMYPDPITGKEEWGIVTGPDGASIIGVHSLSGARPIKVNNFEPPFSPFVDSRSYSEWKFVIDPRALPPAASPSSKP